MVTKFVVLLASFAIGSAAIAQDGASAGSSPVTASAAKKAHTLMFSGHGSYEIFAIDAGPNDTVAAVEVVEGDRAIKIPGSTISAGDKPSQLKTSWTLKDLPAS
jgi:hypothetical protein